MLFRSKCPDCSSKADAIMKFDGIRGTYSIESEY
jgi:hypothetical protein